MIKKKDTIIIKEIRFWNIKINKYLFLHYINPKNKLCKIILLTDFINEILINNDSDVKYNYIRDYIKIKSN